MGGFKGVLGAHRQGESVLRKTNPIVIHIYQKTFQFLKMILHQPKNLINLKFNSTGLLPWLVKSISAMSICLSVCLCYCLHSLAGLHVFKSFSRKWQKVMPNDILRMIVLSVFTSPSGIGDTIRTRKEKRKNVCNFASFEKSEVK